VVGAVVTDVTDTLIIDVPRARTSHIGETVTSVTDPDYPRPEVVARRERPAEAGLPTDFF
jgi:hypothetical protein